MCRELQQAEPEARSEDTSKGATQDAVDGVWEFLSLLIRELYSGTLIAEARHEPD